MIKRSATAEAIFFMLASTVCFAAMNTAIRVVSQTMHSTQIVCLRNICSLGILLAWQIFLHRSLPRFPTCRLASHFWRATIGFVAMELWFHALTLMPLTLATALSFTTPIFSTIIAIAFLGEKAGIRRWSAIMIGSIGVVIILRPDTGSIGPQALLVLASSMMMGITGVLVKTLTRTEPPETIVFYMALFMIPWSILPATWHWQPITVQQWQLILLIALLSTTAHLLLARAFIRADLVLLMPFDFTRLLFTEMLAHFFFGELLDMPTFFGASVILASSVYIAHREARKKPENPITPQPTLP